MQIRYIVVSFALILKLSMKEWGHIAKYRGEGPWVGSFQNSI
jgi:hypothetical protein